MAAKRPPARAWPQLFLGVALGVALTAATLRHAPGSACGEYNCSRRVMLCWPLVWLAAPPPPATRLLSHLCTHARLQTAQH